jgi:hypothetical protein
LKRSEGGKKRVEIAEAREQIKRLKEYIEKVESYQADTYEQKVFKLYVLCENVTKVTKELNEQGYRIGNRKLVTKDLSDLIRSKPSLDEIHELARKLFNRNRKRAATSW